MSEADAAIIDLEPFTTRIEEAFQRFLEVAGQATAEEFAWQPPGEEPSLKRLLEEAADTNNFFYAVVVAKARNQGSLPCIARADFHSLPEALMTIRVSHRRVLNQVVGITVAEFTRPVAQPPLGDLTVRRVLEVMESGYLEKAEQILKGRNKEL